MATLRIAVWGLGRHALDRILPGIAASSGLELHGVCSRNERIVALCAEQWRCKGWTEPRAMLSDSGADVVYVATPIGLHGEHGRQVLAASKHLWSEKPLTSCLQTTLELLEASRRQNLAVCEGLMYLHHPQFLQLREYVTSGRFGDIVSIGCRFGIPPLDHPGFRSDPTLGGGALFDVGCYPVSALQALFPAEEHERVFSRIGSRRGSPVDTDGEAVIALSSGATARLEWRIDCAYRNEIGIWGTAASVVTDRIFSKPASYVPTFRFRDAHGVETTEAGTAGNHFVAMLETFRTVTLSRDACETARADIARRAQTLEEIRCAHDATIARLSEHDMRNLQ